MTRSYYLLINNNPITIAVNVSTPGIVYTQINKKRSGGSVQFVTESKNATGKIAKKVIDKASSLGDCVLEVVSIIDLQTVPEEQWPSCFENLFIGYSMTGGADGNQQFEVDSDDLKKSKSGKIIVATKAIRLTTLN